MKLNRLLVVVVVLALSCMALAQTPQYDVLIRNGRVIDGSGNPWFYADVGIVRDRIVFIGHAAPDVTAKRTIDAKGLVVAPGFIDMLGQSEENLLIDKRALSKLTQGITTEITGEGTSIAPTNEKVLAESREYYEHFKLKPDWLSLEDYFQRLIREGIAINIGTYVGAAQVRKLVIGHENRPATEQEIRDMQEMVDDAMSMGAMGVSSSLIYSPGNFASTEELIALAKPAAKAGGIYATHIRNEGDDETAALNEAFRIAREANIPVEIFHLKVSGRQNWGKMPQVVAAIAGARRDGLDVTADQYPYVASATSLSTPIPPKFHAGGVDTFVARLKDPAQRAEIRREMTEGGKGFESMWRGTGGPQGILVSSVLNPDLKKYEGKRLSEIAEKEHKDALDALLDIVIADHDNAGAVYFTMSEDDVKYAMQQPWVSVGTDYGEVAPDGPLAEFKGHPRGYGSFPRILGKYVREDKTLRLEDAIRKFSSLPAQRVKLVNRGLLRPDYFADITIFDPEKVKDVATFENPVQLSTGIEYVLVNGAVALEHGKTTGEMGGRPLRGPGYSMRPYAPEGLPVRGAIEGVVTDAGGWPVPRANLALLDANGKQIGTFQTKKDGRYEFPLDDACAHCKVTVERSGFTSDQRTFDYNGLNSLWFSFELKRR